MSEPIIAQRSPFVQKAEAGTFWWCACGASKKRAVLRRLAQRHRPRAAQSGYRRSENRCVVRLQALEERRVLRWQSQPSAVKCQIVTSLKRKNRPQNKKIIPWIQEEP